MALVKAPLLSLEASGKLGNAIVFAKWKGRAYVRSLVTPANPKSGGQVGMRAMFKFLSQDWASIGATPQATWETRADQAIVSPFNAFMSYNQYRWRDFLAPTDSDPEDTTDVEPVMGALSATPGVRSVTLSQIITTANDIWGVCFFRSATASFTPAFDNLIGITRAVGVSPVLWVDSPLAAGTYYYDALGFTLDGQRGTEVGEETAVVT